MARIVPVHEGTFTALMEQLQEGYVAAVAAAAGCTINFFRRDTFGRDALVVRHAAPGGIETYLYLQLKNTTTQKPGADANDFTFDFRSREQLDRLRRAPDGQPTIVVVMVSPPRQGDWAQGDHDSLEVRHCCYWRCLSTSDPAETRSDVSVRIHRSQLFDPAGLLDIMDRIDRGEEL